MTSIQLKENVKCYVLTKKEFKQNMVSVDWGETVLFSGYFKELSENMANRCIDVDDDDMSSRDAILDQIDTENYDCIVVVKTNI